ncbi:MAG: hypothetical protein K2P39_11315, partial [Lachnospiraceae bacterium]|nr:hypothetical protein [Lachnospiraceae bacterium]
MVLVDVYVPSVNCTYDFQLDEEVRIGLLIEEIGEMVCRREHCKLDGAMEKLLLCSMDNREIIPRNTTLTEYGVKT